MPRSASMMVAEISKMRAGLLAAHLAKTAPRDGVPVREYFIWGVPPAVARPAG